MGYLTEQLHHLLASESCKANLILKWGNIKHIAIGNITLREVCTNAAHIVNAKNGLLIIVLRSPNKDVGHKVGEVALRACRVHVMSHLPNNWAHNAVVNPLERCDKLSRLLVWILVVAAIHDNSGTLNANHLVVLWCTRSNHQHGETTQ